MQGIVVWVAEDINFMVVVKFLLFCVIGAMYLLDGKRIVKKRYTSNEILANLRAKYSS